MHPFNKVLLIVFLCFSVAGCSTFSFFFERLPWLSSWQLSRMFDLDDDQEVRVEEVAEQIKEWLETEGFPGLVEELDSGLKLWRDSPSADLVTGLFDELESYNSKFLAEIAPLVTPLVMSLRDENLNAFEAYIDEKTGDWFESLETEEDKRDSRVERLEKWFGDLTDAQVAIVRKHVVLYPDERALRLENTGHWVHLFVDSVKNARKNEIENWLREPSVWWTTDYTELRSKNRQQITLILNELVPTLSERQANRAASELQDWIDELRDVTSK